MKIEGNNEVELVRGLQNSEETAFAVVFKIYKTKLYSFAFRFLKNRELSEEIVQETLLTLWTHRFDLKNDYPLAPYLYTIARRLTLNSLRNIAIANSAREKLWLNLLETHNETEEAIILADLNQFIDNVLLKLPTQQKVIFKMSRYEGKSHEEIAKELNISKSTVNNHLVIALKKMKKNYDDS